MRKTLASAVMAAWILTGGLASLGKAAPETSSDGPARITVNVRNYAQVDRKTLVQAGEVARGLLQKAGVEVNIMVLAPEEAYLEGAALEALLTGFFLQQAYDPELHSRHEAARFLIALFDFRVRPEKAKD